MCAGTSIDVANFIVFSFLHWPTDIKLTTMSSYRIVSSTRAPDKHSSSSLQSTSTRVTDWPLSVAITRLTPNASHQWYAWARTNRHTKYFPMVWVSSCLQHPELRFYAFYYVVVKYVSMYVRFSISAWLVWDSGSWSSADTLWFVRKDFKCVMRRKYTWYLEITSTSWRRWCPRRSPCHHYQRTSGHHTNDKRHLRSITTSSLEYFRLCTDEKFEYTTSTRLAGRRVWCLDLRYVCHQSRSPRRKILDSLWIISDSCKKALDRRRQERAPLNSNANPEY